MSTSHEQVQWHLTAARNLVQQSTAYFATRCADSGRIGMDQMDAHQVSLVELAYLATRVEAAFRLLEHAIRLEGEEYPASRLARDLAPRYVADTVRQVRRAMDGRETLFGLTPNQGHDLPLAPLDTWLQPPRERQMADLIAQTNGAGAAGLAPEHQALQATMRRYATDKVLPLAEHLHRQDELLPDSMIAELAELGCFGLSIPTQYGGYQEEARPDHTAMVIVSDALSQASFGTAGSLITRPELLAKALLKGGTEAQKQRWLPLIASGQKQAAVAITKPDFGSDVANLRLAARPEAGGWRLNGRKTWCTFAGRADILMVLARTHPDPSLGHRGLSLFIVEKPSTAGHFFEHGTGNGRLTGRAIATLGYRGMHSFEVVFDDLFVPDANLIGGEEGIGQGFYLQMHGFAGSRLQTAGRALGVMTAAFMAALAYTQQRHVFGRLLFDYPLTQHKLVQMAMLIQAAQQLTYFAAREVDRGQGSVAAAMAKLLTARSAEWIAREAQQLHGGMGYAEEFPVSRHFVDARVLALFEGAEEVLALRVIARALLRAQLGSA